MIKKNRKYKHGQFKSPVGISKNKLDAHNMSIEAYELGFMTIIIKIIIYLKIYQNYLFAQCRNTNEKLWFIKGFSLSGKWII